VTDLGAPYAGAGVDQVHRFPRLGARRGAVGAMLGLVLVLVLTRSGALRGAIPRAPVDSVAPFSSCSTSGSASGTDNCARRVRLCRSPGDA
jgi:hypothetical protein